VEVDPASYDRYGGTFHYEDPLHQCLLHAESLPLAAAAAPESLPRLAAIRKLVPVTIASKLCPGLPGVVLLA
jgi:hypothetical protein